MILPPPPDLMRRFVVTPHHATCLYRGRMISIVSNDSEVIRCFADGPQNVNGASEPGWNCKIIRDTETPIASQEYETFGYNGLEVRSFASGSQFVIDRDAREILAFASPRDPAIFVVGKLRSALNDVL